MRSWFRDFWAELRARSAGRKAMGNDKSTFTSARATMGAIGLNRSNAWDYLENDNGAYLRSIAKEPPLPPSLFVSERDRIRLGQVVPLSERCIEDHGNEDALEVGEWDIEKLEQLPEVGDVPPEFLLRQPSSPDVARSQDPRD